MGSQTKQFFSYFVSMLITDKTIFLVLRLDVLGDLFLRQSMLFISELCETNKTETIFKAKKHFESILTT